MVTPDCGVPALFLNSTWRGVVNAVPTVVVCGVPLRAVMDGGGAAVFVRENVALRLPTLAVTVYGPPAVALAIAMTDATPEALVTAGFPVKVALAPDAGAVNDTDTPLIGLPLVSFTSTCNGVAKLVFTAADCGVPPVAVTLPAEMPVSLMVKFTPPMLMLPVRAAPL